MSQPTVAVTALADVAVKGAGATASLCSFHAEMLRQFTQIHRDFVSALTETTKEPH